MSNPLLGKVWDINSLDIYEKAILWQLVYSADITNKQLAAKCSMALRTVVNKLKSLELKQLIFNRKNHINSENDYVARTASIEEAWQLSRYAPDALSEEVPNKTECIESAPGALSEEVPNKTECMGCTLTVQEMHSQSAPGALSECTRCTLLYSNNINIKNNDKDLSYKTEEEIIILKESQTDEFLTQREGRSWLAKNVGDLFEQRLVEGEAAYRTIDDLIADGMYHIKNRAVGESTKKAANVFIKLLREGKWSIPIKLAIQRTEEAKKREEAWEIEKAQERKDSANIHALLKIAVDENYVKPDPIMAKQFFTEMLKFTRGY